MDDICTYHIQLRGPIDETEINARSPFHLVAEQAEATATLFGVRTDQSGLIGLLRYLHTLGFVLLAVTRDSAER